MDQSKKKILVVEDDTAIALILSKRISDLGFVVLNAASGEDAIDIISKESGNIDLILMDINLGADVMDGVHTTLFIQQSYDIPVIFMSSHSEKEYLQRTENIESYGYFVKDSDDSCLFNSIKTALKFFKIHSEFEKINSQFHEILENTNDGVFTLNRQWQYTYLNYNAGNMMHRRSEDLLGKTLLDEFPEAADNEFVKLYQEVMDTGKSARIEEFYKPLNGWYEISIYPNKEGITVFYRDITKRKRIEEELEKQKSFFEQMFIQSATSTQILDKDGLCLRINPKLSELFGVKPEQIEGQYNIFKDEEVKRHGIDLSLRKVYKEKHTAYNEVNFDIGRASDSQHFDVKERKGVWVASKAYPVVSDNGEVEYVIIQHEDISERKKTEEALRDSEELFRTSFKNATTGVCLTAIDGRFLKVNNTLCNILGYKPDELKQMKFIDITFPDDREVGLTFMKKLIEGTIDNCCFEKRYVCKNGNVICASVSVALIKETLRNAAYFITHIQDITEHKRSKDLLKQSEQEFRNLFENAVLGLYRTSPDGKIIKVNKALCKMLGYSSEAQLMERNLENEGFHPNYQRKTFKDKFAGNNNYICLESVWNKADGSVIFVRENAKAVRDREGNILYYDGTVEDITEGKLAEDALTKSEEKYRLLFENNPLPMWIYDLKTLKFLEVNKAAIEHYGYSKQEFMEMTIKDIRPEEDVPLLLSTVNRFSDEQNKLKEWRHIKKNGDLIYVEIISHSIEYNGEIVRLILSNDVTERKKNQEELILAKKEAEKSDQLKSEFLAQMSHEIRSPINTMLNFISLIKEEMEKPGSSEINFAFTAIDSSSRRLIRTIDLILNMSQVQTGYLECKYQTINLEKDVLDYLVNEYATSAELKGLRLSIISETGNTNIYADSYTVIQIFSNIINNAIKYTMQGEIKIIIYRDKEDNLCVDISDTGIGISEEYISHIFTPFSQEEQGYTRKFEGNGLGLALVKKYCELNNAEVKVFSKKGVGSIFTVLFRNC